MYENRARQMMRIAREWKLTLDEEDDNKPTYKIVEQYSNKVIAYGLPNAEALEVILAHNKSTDSPKTVLTQIANNYHNCAGLLSIPHEGLFERCDFSSCSDARKALAQL
jgi:hypothetical protein